MRFVPSTRLVAIFLLVLAVFSAKPALAAPFVIPGSENAYWQRQWYLRQIQAPDAWRKLATTPVKDVVVAVIDAGVDVTHPDLKDALWTNTREITGNGVDDDGNGFIDDIHGWNFVTKSGDVRPMELRDQLEEAWSHGTFVASLIGARSLDHVGMVGVNQSVQIMPLTALDGDGFGTIPNVLQAMRYAVNNGASIINLSLAGFDDSEDLQEMIQRTHDAGVLVVAATGNGPMAPGRDTDREPIFPACFDRETNLVVGVSGTDSLDQHASYANYGIRCTDLSAPGFELFGARPSYPRREEGGRPAERYLEGMTGTSLAAPLVSGVASLLKAVQPALSVDQLHRILTATTDNIEASLKPSEKGKMGSGRLNAFKAVQMALAATDASPQSVTRLIEGVGTTTSTEEAPGATSFYVRSTTSTLRWLVAPKPLAYVWRERAGVLSVSAFVKDGSRYFVKRWDASLNKEEVVRVVPPKGLPSVMRVSWDASREVWLIVDKNNAPLWRVDPLGRVTSAKSKT